MIEVAFSKFGRGGRSGLINGEPLSADQRHGDADSRSALPRERFRLCAGMSAAWRGSFCPNLRR